MRGNLSKKWCLSDTVKLILFDLKSQMERPDSMPHNPLTQEGTFLKYIYYFVYIIYMISIMEVYQ